MKISRFSLAGAFVLLAAGLAARGDNPAAKADKSQMHDELGRLVGSWDAAVTYRMGEKEKHGKARCEAKWILGDHCVQQEYDSSIMGRPLQILQLLSYDAGQKKLVEIHLQNSDGGAMRNEGESVDGGKEWKLSGPFMDPMTQKKTTLRTVYTFEGPDQFTLDWFMQGPDGKEVRAVHIVHTRRK